MGKGRAKRGGWRACRVSVGSLDKRGVGGGIVSDT